jgi:hypothetical protein
MVRVFCMIRTIWTRLEFAGKIWTRQGSAHWNICEGYLYEWIFVGDVYLENVQKCLSVRVIDSRGGREMLPVPPTWELAHAH